MLARAPADVNESLLRSPIHRIAPRIHPVDAYPVAPARVTDRVPARTVWMRDGWDGLNRLTSGEACIPDAAVDLFGFSAGQAAFDATVEVAPA